MFSAISTEPNPDGTPSADTEQPRSGRKMGLVLLAVGLLLSVLCHLSGSRDLLRFGGTWRSVHSEELGYDIPCYDARPAEPEIGRVVIHRGFGASTQVYFPLAVSLLRSGYAVRLVANSGSPNSGVLMSYRSHGVEAMEGTHQFLSVRPDLPHFLVGHSEGTRYALQIANELVSVDGVVVLSTISASLNAERPANVLILVAEKDFANVRRQTNAALGSGTGVKRPKYGELYGDTEEGTGRMARVMPGTNHAGIVLNEAAHRAVLGWLNQISGSTDRTVRISGALKLPILAIGALLGVAIGMAGIGLIFQQALPPSDRGASRAWVIIVLALAGWALAAFLADSISWARDIPLLVYGRLLVFFAIAATPLLVFSAVKPKLGAGMPGGSWKARALMLALMLTLLLFDRWLMDVTPSGQRLLWFSLATLVTGCYFAGDEFLRRGVQRATDWQTGFALGLAVSFIAAVSVAGSAFFVPSMVGQFMVAGSVTLFVLMVGCEIPATYLFAKTGDWMLSWWVRVSVFNGFLAGLVPLVSENEFRKMLS